MIDATAIAQNFTAYAAARMGKSAGEISACLSRLSEEQMHCRGGEHENSIVNLLLHLDGNIRQWAIHGVGGAPDVRERDAEFALDADVSGADAWQRLASAIDEARTIIAAVPAKRLLDIIDPQPTGIHRNPTVLEAIAKVMGHLEHHTGQIILLTKQFAATDLDLSMPRKR